ncbi:uncharacterized protein VTP21DRAFT_3689 [Calcarisporiella thermophila]|uniref:uncharacterized protein n=1 Tax=Calcarisporiella thermophila TaxID=911321 RepID=UPI0037441C98
MLRAKTVLVRAPNAIRKLYVSRRHVSFSKAEEVEVFVDGKSVKIEQGAAVIQACEKAGVPIPRFCYHERLSVAGNCRMCLVEVEKSPKPVASCAFPVMPGMKIKTDTPLVHRAREGVMEFLLANHPLDCPICDQGGECDLQDQSVRYGSDRGRFREIVGKRAVEEKDFGPFVKTVMTRCIHCTRCVRFANEVAGATELGTSGRGNDMQIGTYVEQAIDSEMSGNIIDLCPVGALTSKPYAFTSRPWELNKTETVDVMDAIGSNIRVDSRGVEVMRVVPRLNDELNEEWISDKTRFAYDGLKRQRLNMPLARQGGQFVPVSWEQALQLAAEKAHAAKGNEIKAIAGHLADVESMLALKDLLNRLGSENLALDQPLGDKPPAHGVDFRSNYTLSTTLARVEDADAVLLVGTNPRHEGPILNARLRKGYLHTGADLALVGTPVDLTYEYAHVGERSRAVEEVLEGGQHPFSKRLAEATHPMIIVGSGVMETPDAPYVLSRLAEYVDKHRARFIRDDWRGFNVFQRAAARTGAYDLGFVASKEAEGVDAKFVYLLNADEISGKELPKEAFVVYQGHHGDTGAQYADLIFPGTAYTEKNATYVNTEGRTQLTRAAVSPPGASREDWKIIRAFSEVVGATLPYDDIYSLRERMGEIAPHLVHYGVVEPSAVAELAVKSLVKEGVKAEDIAFRPVIEDFYLTDPISRTSSNMAKGSAYFTKRTAKVGEDAGDEVRIAV